MTTHTLSLGPLSLLATQTGPLLSVTIHTPSDTAPVGKMTLTVPEWTSLVAFVDGIALADRRAEEQRVEIERLRALAMNPGATLHGSTIAEAVKERDEYHEMLRTILAACDDSTRASIGGDAPLRAVRKVVADRDDWRRACADRDERAVMLANDRDSLRQQVRELTEERDMARADMEAAEQRMLGVLDGTFTVGDGTAQKEIERLRKALEEACGLAEHVHESLCPAIHDRECQFKYTDARIAELRALATQKDGGK